MTDEQRLIELETKFSYQQVLIDELRSTVDEQYLAIERLEKGLKALTDKIVSQSSPLQHEKPPHY